MTHYLHTIPLNDTKNKELFVHAASEKCECFPVRDTEVEGIFIHNAFDCRDARERFGAVENPWVIIRQIKD